ncbi:hypothetical protein [Nostoc sp.]|uniref:hypothetical protein n=1 Tax=Nostoc sp. TaxID=1180 RepID=UPI002FF97D68
MQLLYERLRQGEVEIIVGAQHVVPLAVCFIYLQYAVCETWAAIAATLIPQALQQKRENHTPNSWIKILQCTI